MLIALLLTFAQIQIGAVEGTITDGTGARVPNASVVLYDTVTGFERSQTTRDTGTFRFDNLPFGLYSLRVMAPGFQPHDSTVSLRSNLAVTVDLELTLAGPAEDVTVRAETPLIDPERISTTTRLDGSFGAAYRVLVQARVCSSSWRPLPGGQPKTTEFSTHAASTTAFSTSATASPSKIASIRSLPARSTRTRSSRSRSSTDTFRSSTDMHQEA